MSKHTYRAKKINEIDWSQLWNGWAGQPLVLAVDIAKDTQYAELSAQGQGKTVLLKWNHLKESTTLIDHLKRFGEGVTIVMESSGTYGDSLRHLCRQEQLWSGPFLLYTYLYFINKCKNKDLTPCYRYPNR